MTPEAFFIPVCMFVLLKKSACHASNRSCIRAFSIRESRLRGQTCVSRILNLHLRFMLVAHVGPSKRNETLRPALLISNTPRYSGTRRRFHPEVTAPNLVRA